MRKTILTMGEFNFIFLYGAVMQNTVSCISFFPPRPSVARFILEPKSVLFNEQEQKLNDSESAIASMQVCLIADPVLPDCVETEISIDFSLFVCYFLVRHPKTTLRNSRAKWRTILGSCFNRTQDLRVRSSQ